MKNKTLIVMISLFFSLLTGCSTSSIRVHEKSVPFAKFVTPESPLFDLKISMTPQTQKIYDDEARLRGFDADKLLAVTLQRLEERKLLQFDSTAGLYLAEIRITGLDIKPASNRINWGILAGSDNIQADINVFHRHSGDKVSSIAINVNHIADMTISAYKWSPEYRMNYIYKTFAERVEQSFGQKLED